MEASGLAEAVTGVAEEEVVVMVTEVEVGRVLMVRVREATVAEQQSEDWPRAEAGEGLGVAGPGGGATLHLCSTSLLELEIIIEWTNQGPLMVRLKGAKRRGGLVQRIVTMGCSFRF